MRSWSGLLGFLAHLKIIPPDANKMWGMNGPTWSRAQRRYNKAYAPEEISSTKPSSKALSADM